MMVFFKCPYCRTEYEMTTARLSFQQRSYANCSTKAMRSTRSASFRRRAAQARDCEVALLTLCAIFVFKLTSRLACGIKHGNPLHKAGICGRLAQKCPDVPRKDIGCARRATGPRQAWVALLKLVLGVGISHALPFFFAYFIGNSSLRGLPRPQLALATAAENAIDSVSVTKSEEVDLALYTTDDADGFTKAARCVTEAVYTVEAAVAVGVLPFCAKMSPEAATPRIINAATTMTTKRI
jgi:hypothetical protein